MPNLSSIITPGNVITSDNEITLTNKTLTDPIIQYVAGDTSFTVPAGTTGERPSSPGIGELRFNTDEGSLEQYDGTNWGAVVPDDLDINTLSINGTLLTDGESIRVPSGTTGERPASPTAGELRFNTDESALEQYDGSEWGSIGGGGPFLESIASGTLSDGTPVIINNDGTVSVVNGTSVPQDSGSPVQIENTEFEDITSTFDNNSNKVIIGYYDNSNFAGRAVVGDVSGTSITFGTPVEFYNGRPGGLSSTFDSSNNKVVFSYQDLDNSNRGAAVVGDVSGTSITFGTPVEFDGISVGDTSAVFDNSNNKVIISYRSAGDGDDGKSVVGDVSGTSITFGTPVVYNNNRTFDTAATFDSSNNKVVIAFRDQAFDNSGAAVVGEVSGTSITFGSKETFFSESAAQVTSTFDSSNNKVVIAFRDTTLFDNGIAVVGDVSGTSITFGFPIVFKSNKAFTPSITFDSNSNKVVIGFRDEILGLFPSIVSGEVSGTSIAFDAPRVIQSSESGENTIVFDSNSNKVVFATEDVSDSRIGKAIVFQNPSIDSNLTFDNYIGFSDGSYNDGETATVQIVGSIVDGQSGLTPGNKYYIQPDGSLNTTNDTFSVEVGTAVASDKIIVKG